MSVSSSGDAVSGDMDLFNMIDQFSRELDQIVSSVASDTQAAAAADDSTEPFDSFVRHVAVLDQDDSSEDDKGDEAPVECTLVPAVRSVNINPIPMPVAVTTIDPLMEEITTASAPSTPKVSQYSSSSSSEQQHHDQDDDGEHSNQQAALGWGSWLSAATSKLKESSTSLSYHLPSENATYQAFARMGATEISISALSQTKIPFFVEKKKPIMWKICIRDYDVRFSINLRLQSDGGSVEKEMEPQITLRRSDNVLIGYRRASDVDRHLLFVFDNSYSKLRSKNCAYKVMVGASAVREIEDFVLEQEEAAKDRDMGGDRGATEGNPNPNPSPAAAAYVSMSLFKNMIANAHINVASFLTSPSKITTITSSSSSSRKFDDVQCVDIRDFLGDDEEDSSRGVSDSAAAANLDDSAYEEEEEESFVQSPPPSTHPAMLKPSIADPGAESAYTVTAGGFIVLRNAVTSPESFEQLWINYFGSAHTLVIFVRPIAAIERGFPSVTLCAHLEDCGVFNIAKGPLPPQGVKLYSYMEGIDSSRHSSNVQCMVEVTCSAVDGTVGVFELSMTVKATDTRHFKDFVRAMRLSSIFRSIDFDSPDMKGFYSGIL